MKNLIVITYCLGMLMCGGCFESAKMQTFADDVITFSEAIDSYQETTNELIDTLADANLVNENIAAKIDRVNEEIDRIQPQIVDVAEAIKGADYVSGDDVGNLIRAAKAGTAATAPYNPYAVPIIAALTLLEGITAIFWKKKKDEATTAERKRQADKEGRERTLREIAAMDDEKITAPIVKSLMYTNIGEARKGLGI